MLLSFVNLVFLGAGANVWGAGTLMTGIVVIALIIPVFCFRHFIQDGGKFPARMMEDIEGDGSVDVNKKNAGVLPYVALAAGVAVVLFTNTTFG